MGAPENHLIFILCLSGLKTKLTETLREYGEQTVMFFFP